MILIFCYDFSFFLTALSLPCYIFIIQRKIGLTETLTTDILATFAATKYALPMSKTLLRFNPDHDLAMAADSAHYTAPPNAALFAVDMATLPCWITSEGEAVSPLPLVKEYHALGGRCTSASTLIAKAYDSVLPWGWNKAEYHRLLRQGFLPEQLPNPSSIERVRELSHRITASRLAQSLSTLPFPFPPTAEQLTTMEQIDTYIKKYPAVVLKAPWSGSGRGLMWATGSLTPANENRCRKLLQSQGCVMGEMRQEVIQDFAMEFLRTETAISFTGYSVFGTKNGVYAYSLLGDEAYLESVLTQYIAKDTLLAVREACTRFIAEELKGYEGNVGIDMFVFRNADGYSLNPAVEVNMRNTMGNVALELSKRWLAPGSHGRYYIDFYADASQLLSDHLHQQKEKPLTLHEGKIVKGYLSLCPVTSTTHYRARLEIES